MDFQYCLISFITEYFTGKNLKGTLMKYRTIVKVILKNIKAWTLKFFGLGHKVRPYKILIQTTNDCNSKCHYCHIWKINKDNPELKKQELNINDYENIFKDINTELIWLALSGGEITISEHITELILLAKKHCPSLSFITFTTNGLLPKKVLEIALFIKDLNLDCFVTISLDGDEKTHDQLRGIPGNFNKVMQTQDLLKKAGIKTYLGITLNEENNDFIKNHYQQYKHDLKSITFVHSEGIYNVKNKKDDLIIIDSLKHIYKNFKISGMADIIEKIYLKLGIIFLLRNRKENIIPCDAGSSSLHISPRGEVSPCMFLPESGNIKSTSLENILQSKTFHEHKRRARQAECSKCWLNCYAPHSIMKSPLKSIFNSFKSWKGV
jgi:MoaA/NifB/PqqE/SkfB family radical SAM enzyme